MFAPLFAPLIAAYHMLDDADACHVTDFDATKVPAEPLPSAAVLSTRIRVGRNLAGIPLAPAITRAQRNEVMERVRAATDALRDDDDLSGVFHPLAGMDDATRAALVADHFLFKQGDRFLEAAGANRDWPEGRAVWFNRNKTALVWGAFIIFASCPRMILSVLCFHCANTLFCELSVNEEDQLRIISMQPGGDVRAVFERLVRLLRALERSLAFAHHARYGAVSSCPTNLGTAMRASVHVRLPHLAQRPEALHRLCAAHRLSIRGTHGEHSDAVGGVFDISNTQRLGLTEVEAVALMCAGVRVLIDEDATLAARLAQPAALL